MRKTHYSKTEADTTAKGVETYGHMSTLNMNKRLQPQCHAKRHFKDAPLKKIRIAPFMKLAFNHHDSPKLYILYRFTSNY